MAQYINKSAVIAEIERTINFHEERGNQHDSSICDVLYGLSHRIDTVEVKEVDLEKELESWRHNHFHGRRDIFANGEYLERVSQLGIAKHFFELGLKTKRE